MAELVGLAASIVQLGGAGTELSKALYNFVSSAARADTEIKDLAGDVKLTCRALDRVGDTLRTEASSSGSMLKREAIDEAEEIKLRCESIFTEISEIFERRWIRDKDGKRILSILGKVAWPLKEQKVELLRRRLESLKLSLLLLLNVLQLAHEQARGKLAADLEKERQTIRSLHRQKKMAFQREHDLEEEFRKLQLGGSDNQAASVTNASVLATNDENFGSHLRICANRRAAEDLDACAESDRDDKDLTMDDLTKCADHVRDLLKHINDMYKSLEAGLELGSHRQRWMHKVFKRYRREFEADILRGPNSIVAPSLQEVEVYQPPLYTRSTTNTEQGAAPTNVSSFKSSNAPARPSNLVYDPTHNLAQESNLERSTWKGRLRSVTKIPINRQETPSSPHRQPGLRHTGNRTQSRTAKRRMGLPETCDIAQPQSLRVIAHDQYIGFQPEVTPLSGDSEHRSLTHTRHISGPVMVDYMDTSGMLHEPFVSAPYLGSGGYASPTPGPQFDQICAMPSYGSFTARTRTSSNATFIEQTRTHVPQSPTSSIALLHSCPPVSCLATSVARHASSTACGEFNIPDKHHNECTSPPVAQPSSELESSTPSGYTRSKAKEKAGNNVIGSRSQLDEPSVVVVNHTNTGRISKARNGSKTHECEHCGRSYTRAEHLRRHQRNHDQEGAVTCKYPSCGKTFYRSDLLQRHEDRQSVQNRLFRDMKLTQDSLSSRYESARSSMSGIEHSAHPSPIPVPAWLPAMPASTLPSAVAYLSKHSMPAQSQSYADHDFAQQPEYGYQYKLDSTIRLLRSSSKRPIGFEEAVSGNCRTVKYQHFDANASDTEDLRNQKRRKTAHHDRGTVREAQVKIISVRDASKGGEEGVDQDGGQSDEDIVDVLLEQWTVQVA